MPDANALGAPVLKDEARFEGHAVAFDPLAAPTDDPEKAARKRAAREQVQAAAAGILTSALLAGEMAAAVYRGQLL